jgi:hypothetical protein
VIGVVVKPCAGHEQQGFTSHARSEAADLPCIDRSRHCGCASRRSSVAASVSGRNACSVVNFW